MSKPVIFYILHYLDNLGGTENHVKDLAKGLSEKYEIYILYREREQIVIKFADGQIERYTTEPIQWLFIPFNSSSCEMVLKKLIDRFKPEIVHIHHLLNWPLSTLKILEQAKIKTVITFHDYFLITPEFTMQSLHKLEHYTTLEYANALGLRDNAYLLKRQHVLKEQIAKIDHLISPSNYTAQIFQEAYQIKSKVIEHGISAFSAEQKTRSEKLRIGYIGSLLPQKGWQILLEVFNGLALDGIELHFYGGLSDKQFKNVTFHGVYSREDLSIICQNIDLAVIPSVFPESYCYTLSELWMGKVPVIASEIGALTERIATDTNNTSARGALFRAGDHGALKTSLLDQFNNSGYKSWQIDQPKKIEAMLADYDKLYSDK